MRIFRILYFKELKSYFLSPFGWLILAFAALMQALILATTLKAFADEPQPQSLITAYFTAPFFWFFFLFLFPVLTMRLFAEETRSGTLEGLLTAPLKSSQVVLSKFAAAYTTFLLLWIPAFFHFKLFTLLTELPPPFNNGELIGAFLGLALIGLLFTTIGCLTSALTSRQIIAGLLCVGILLLLFLLGLVTTYFGDQIPAAAFFDFLSSQNHLLDFSRGLLDSRPVVYYLAASSFILFLTHHLLDYRRWKR